MSKALKIVIGLIALLVIVSFVMVQFFMPQGVTEKVDVPEDIEYDVFGEGPNPFPKGSPQYANWQKVASKKTKEDNNDGSENEASTD